MLGEQTLPSRAEAEAGVGPKGAAARISCPALENCWMATTEGWLFHLAPEGERTLRPNEISGFHNVISYRPPDQGLPQVVADAPPPDTSGLNEEGFVVPKFVKGEESKPSSESKVQLPLLSRLHSKLIHHTTLQLSFHLAVKARVRLLAKRNGRLVAVHPHAHPEGRHPHAAPEPQPAELADQAEPADARARAAAARLLGDGRRRQRQRPCRPGWSCCRAR